MANRKIYFARVILQNAATSNKVAGAFCILFGVLLFALTGISTRIGSDIYILLLAFFLVYFLPGIIYFCLAPPLKKGRTWAAVTSIVIASLHSAFTALLFLVSLIGLGLLGMVISGITVLTLVLVIYSSARCFSAIRRLQSEPSAVIPVYQPESWDQPAETADAAVEEASGDPAPADETRPGGESADAAQDAGQWPEIR